MLEAGRSDHPPIPPFAISPTRIKLCSDYCAIGNAMPTLDWIGKRAVINHHLTVPYRLLKGEEERSVGEAGSGNLLVQGDNLLALKALLLGRPEPRPD